MPPFSSSIHFELYRRAAADDEYYVKLFYRRDGFEYLPQLEFPNCGTSKCSLDSLYELYTDVIPKVNETVRSLCHS